jgi:hypothetical protein
MVQTVARCEADVNFYHNVTDLREPGHAHFLLQLASSTRDNVTDRTRKEIKEAALRLPITPTGAARCDLGVHKRRGSTMTEMAVMATIATGIIMASHPSAVIGTTPLFLCLREWDPAAKKKKKKKGGKKSSFDFQMPKSRSRQNPGADELDPPDTGISSSSVKSVVAFLFFPDFLPPLAAAMAALFEKYVLLVRRKICAFGPAKNMYFWADEKCALLGRRKICTFRPTKNMYFWADEKYALFVRRKVYTYGPGGNMNFWTGEKYVLLGRRKICTFRPTKNMHFWADEKYALFVRRKIYTYGPWRGQCGRAAACFVDSPVGLQLRV